MGNQSKIGRIHVGILRLTVRDNDDMGSLSSLAIETSVPSFTSLGLYVRGSVLPACCCFRLDVHLAFDACDVSVADVKHKMIK